MKLLNKDNIVIEEVDFGLVEVLSTKQVELTLWNDSEGEVTDIVVTISNKEVSIVKQPSFLLPDGKEALVLSWTPTLEVKRGLKTTVSVQGTEIYRP